MTTTSRALALGAGITLLLALPFAAQAGPAPVVTPYLSAANSPFSSGSFTYFHLENFEDHLLNTPGVSANTGIVTGSGFSGTIIDSVQGDGACPQVSAPNPCDSYFSGSAGAGIIFTFNAGTLGALPTAAGLVWTDGGGGASATLEAFGLGMVSLGTVTALNIGDFSNHGTTAEDTFLGWTDLGGILAIKISDTGGGGIEIDHLQYGGPPSQPSTGVPEPASLLLIGAGLVGLAAWRSRRK